ncbi:MAG: inorganic phosphate transporter [Cyanosarcina radialis HA8281-LM2]|jgi:PiT family inorganic phosphate transporter|nr:inorganic phosphate transporter [Cyanosarcina radialis HA8281-LM2]
MIFFVVFLAFYLACNLGANDVANSMGTSVGSKALTLKQAIIVAGILEFTGAVLFGGGVSETIATDIANPPLFAAAPQLLLSGMVAALISVGLWMQIATSRGWPVSSSHGIVGAIAGFSWVAAGVGAVDWSTIGAISIAWVLTPLASGIIAAAFYSLIKRAILDRPDPLASLQQWIPWLSVALLSIFGAIVLPALSAPVNTWLAANWGLNLPGQDLPIVVVAIGSVVLTRFSWQQLESGTETNAAKYPTCDRGERVWGKFQVLSACFVAFAHGSNDVGNAIAPLAAIVYIQSTGSVPLADFHVPLWILVVGGAGIVAGLAVWGKKVIATIGENIIALEPSSGFSAELATATTILLASRLGLPVSTSHALVGAVVGIGLVKDWRSVRFQTLKSIGLAWLITIPVTTILGATIFWLIRAIWL